MRRQRYSQLANKLQPYMNQSSVVIFNTGATGEAPGDHVHDFTGLEGELLPEQAPWVTTALNALKPHGLTDPVYHSVTGAALSVVGLTADNTIGLLSSTDDAPANPNTLLRGGAAGAVTLGALTVQDGVNPQIAITTDEGRLFPNTRLQTDNFSSQLAGWRMTYAGELDARYIFANEMKIIKFIADMQQALAGSQIISKSVTTLAAQFVAPRPGGNAGLIVDDLPSAEGMPVFEDGDTVLVTEDSRAGGGFSSLRCWGTVSGYTDLPDKKQDWTFTRYGDFGLSVPTWTGAPRQANASGTILSVTKVDATVSGNQMIACVLVESTSVTTTAPAGWTQIHTATVTGMRATLYSKVAGGSEPATYVWTHSSSVDSMVILENFSLQDPTTPISGWAVNVHETATAAPVIKSVTPVSDTDFYIGFVAARANRHPVIQPSGWVSDVTFTAGGNTLAAMHSLTDGYAGVPFGDVSAALTGGTARCITFTVNIIPQPIVLDLETGYMPIGTAVEPGAFILDYGVSGNGWHEITAIDGIYGSNSPYSRVVSWIGHPATGAIVRTQSGNLNGIFGEGAEWGFFAGNGVSPTVSQFLRLSDRGARLNNLALSLYSAGEQRVNISADGQDVWIGTLADKRLSWNGVALAVKGAVTIDQASGFAGSGYLQVGTGVKDSDLSGWNLGPAEIVGQLAGVDQVVLDLSGRILAGGGNVWMDATGINTLHQTTETRLSHNSLRGYTFRRSDNGAVIGRLTGSYLSGIDQYGIDLYAMAPGTQKAKAVLGAQYYDAIYAGSSPGAPRVEAYSDPATMDLLRLYSAGKIQMYQSGNTTPDIEISSGSIKPYAPFSAIGLGVAPTFAVWTSSGWQKMIEMAQGMALLWQKGGSGSARGIGASSDGVLYITSSTANDTSAAANYDLLVYPSGDTQIRSNLSIGGVLRTTSNIPWNFGAYTAGAPTATGYLTVTVNGSTYRIAAQAV